MTAPIIEVQDLWHWYLRGTPLESIALRGASFSLAAGEVVGVMGHTGSGKSTLVQHFNALLRPHRGSVRVFGQDLSDRHFDPRPLRRRVGLVFQFPEQQLFDPTVADDIAFGPRKHGCDRAEVRRRVTRAMDLVGLPFEAFKDRYTFGLSGGELRKVALAGVLALEPEVLVLDEPTAGLDPRARRELLAALRELHDRIATSGLPFGRARYTFSPHCTLSLYATHSPEVEKEILRARIDEPVLIDAIQLYHTRDPQPSRKLLELPLTGENPAH
jgi:energy-coupling factor transport system ATP-binding protein